MTYAQIDNNGIVTSLIEATPKEAAKRGLVDTYTGIKIGVEYKPTTLEDIKTQLDTLEAAIQSLTSRLWGGVL